MLAQELEQARYQLVQWQKEEDARLAAKETELRRATTKLKSLEADFKAATHHLNEERKRCQEASRALESTSTFLADSHAYLHSYMMNALSAIKNSLLNLG